MNDFAYSVPLCTCEVCYYNLKNIAAKLLRFKQTSDFIRILFHLSLAEFGGSLNRISELDKLLHLLCCFIDAYFCVDDDSSLFSLVREKEIDRPPARLRLGYLGTKKGMKTPLFKLIALLCSTSNHSGKYSIFLIQQFFRTANLCNLPLIKYDNCIIIHNSV